MIETGAPASPRPRSWLPALIFGGLLMFCCLALLPGFDRHPGGQGSWEIGLPTLLGCLISAQLAVLVPLLLGPAGGAGPTLLFVGSGPLLGVRRGARVPVALGAVPLLPLGVRYATTSPSRLRAGVLLLAQAAVGLGVAESLLSSDSSFLWGTGRGVVLGTVLAVVLPSAGPDAGGTERWSTPPWPRDARLALDPVGLAAARALAGGDVVRARAELGDRQGTLTDLQLQVALATAEGRCAEALRLAVAGHGTVLDEDLRVLEARAACHAVESGELEPEQAQVSLRLLYAHGPRRLFRASELPATRALRAGEPADAVRLAKRALRATGDLPTRAYALCTLAAAQAATGDRAGAERSLRRARAAAPGLARIDVVQGLVSSAS